VSTMSLPCPGEFLGRGGHLSSNKDRLLHERPLGRAVAGKGGEVEDAVSVANRERATGRVAVR
jgi:hypothetical protein